MTEELQRLHQRCWDLETQLEISHKRLEISESLQKLFKRHHLSLQHDVERDAELAEREHVWADTRWEVALHAVQISQKLMAAKEMVWKKTVNEEKKKEDGLSEDLNEKDKEIARLRMELERMDDLEKRNEKCFKDLARVSEEFESVSEALKREEIERKEEINTLREELRDSRKANTELQKEIKTMTKEHEKRSKHDADKIQKLKTALRQVKTLIANDPQPSSHQDRKQPRRESGEPVEDFQENDDAETEDFVSPLVQKKSQPHDKTSFFSSFRDEPSEDGPGDSHQIENEDNDGQEEEEERAGEHRGKRTTKKRRLMTAPSIPFASPAIPQISSKSIRSRELRIPKTRAKKK